MRARAMLQQRGLNPENSAPNPDPESAPPSGLYSNIVQPAIQQPNVQEPPSGLYSNIVQPAIQQPSEQKPYVDSSIPNQLAALPLQTQEVRDVKPAVVPNVFAGDPALQNLAFNRQQLQQQQLQQQQLMLQQQQQLLMQQQQQLYGQDNYMNNFQMTK